MKLKFISLGLLTLCINIQSAIAQEDDDAGKDLGALTIPLYSNFTQLLGLVGPGLQTTSSTAPGAFANIAIRGHSNLFYEQSPNIFLDGMPYSGSLNSINIHSISEIKVLRSPLMSRAPLQYGANGIIEIKTKRSVGAYSKKWKFELDINTGVTSRAISEYDLITDPAQYYETLFKVDRTNSYGILGDWEQAANYSAQNMLNNRRINNIYDVPNNSLIDPRTGKVNPNAQIRFQDNAAKLLQRVGLRQTYNFHASKTFDKGAVSIQSGYLNENSYLRNNDFKRFDLNTSAYWKPIEKLSLGINAYYAKSGGAFIDFESIETKVNPFTYMRQASPANLTFERDANGNIMQDPNSGKPVYTSELGYSTAWFFNNQRSSNNHTLRVSPHVNFEVSDKLNVKLNTAFTQNSLQRNEDNEVLYLLGMNMGIESGVISTKGNMQQLNLNPSIEYTDRSGNHAWNGLLQYMFDNLSHKNQNRYSLPLNAFFSDYLNYHRKNVQHSIDWKGKYAYKEDRIQINANLNYTNNQHVNVFYTEPIKNTAFNYAFGLSHVSKNSKLGVWSDYSNLSMFSSPNADRSFQMSYDFYYSNTNAFPFWRYFNSHIPRQKQTDVGIFYNLKKNTQIRLIAFERTVSNSLFERDTTFIVHNPFQYQSSGPDIRNRGLEFEIRYKPVNNTTFSWDIEFNLSHIKTTVSNISNDSLLMKDGLMNINNQTMNMLYTPQMQGIDPNNGLPLYSTANGGVTTDYYMLTFKDYVLQGSIAPLAFGSLTNNIRWKQLSLRLALNYSLCGKIYDQVYASSMNSEIQYIGNYHKDIINSWTLDNQNSSIPGFGQSSSTSFSQRFVSDASWLNIKQMMINYRLPIKWFRKSAYQSMNLYLAGDNLFFFSARKGMNPNSNFNGRVESSYIPIRTVIAGVNIVF